MEYFHSECSSREEIQTQNSNVYNLNEVIIQTQRNFFPPRKWINKLLSEEMKFPEHCLKLERWQGLPHVNTVKQYYLYCPWRSVSSFSLFNYENSVTVSEDFSVLTTFFP